MAEQIRSVHVRIEVDTNKRTVVIDEQVDSLADIERVVAECIEELE